MNPTYITKLQDARLVCVGMFALYVLTAVVLVSAGLYLCALLAGIMRRVWRVQSKYDQTRKLLNSRSSILTSQMSIDDIWRWQTLRDKLSASSTSFGSRYADGTFDSADTVAEEPLRETTASVGGSYDAFVKKHNFCYGDVKTAAGLGESGDNYAGGEVVATDECKRVFGSQKPTRAT